MSASSSVESRLLLSLQKGLPVDARPFARLADDLGLTEADVLGQVQALFDSGVARRFGAVFDSHSLGYASTLCAVEIPAAELEGAVARLTPHPGITHCYERDGHPNLWFTMTAPAGCLEREIERVRAAIGLYPVWNLPALRKFKIEAVFGREAGGRASAPPKPRHGKVMPISPREQEVVRCLQRSIPVVADPFGEVARQAGYAPEELLALLGRWLHEGVIRRIALVVRHHKIGFSANSMCVWPVEAGSIDEAGRAMARNPHVTHCYERPSTPVFPYSLYAMIHAKSREDAVAVFEALGRDAGVSGGRMMWSLREFKKSSPVFFCEPPGDPGMPPP